VDSILDLFQAASSQYLDFLCGGVNLTWLNEVLELDVETGNLQEVHAGTGDRSATAGGGPDAMSRATMGKLQFHTDAIVDGRRVRGGPFLGPLGTNALTSNGHVSASFDDAVRTAFDGLMNALPVTAARLAVFQRPREAAPGVTARVGSFGHVQSVSLKQAPAVLRSRRD
jgi:hypothetical protein